MAKEMIISGSEEFDHDTGLVLKPYDGDSAETDKCYYPTQFATLNLCTGKNIRDKKNELFDLLMDSNSSIKIILNYIYETNLLNIPPLLIQALILDNYAVETDSSSSEIIAYSQALDAKLDQLFKYASYIDGSSAFDTHQGVKGLQFERVMAILDDDEAGGFLFNYDKFLGIKSLSDSDKKNEAQGEDNALYSTRRLFYVICSRAEKSLAVVCYTKNSEF